MEYEVQGWDAKVKKSIGEEGGKKKKIYKKGLDK